MWLAHKLNIRCLFSGNPGTGKSTSPEQFAGWLRQPFMQFNGKDGMEPSSVLGTPWGDSEVVKDKDGNEVVKNFMSWKDGGLPIALKKGYLVVLDECFKLNAGMMMTIQPLRSSDGYLTLDDKPGSIADKIVRPHKNFRFFFTDNVKGCGENIGRFGATQIQDTSSLDGFGITINFDYMSAEEEKEMLYNKYPELQAIEKASITIDRVLQLASLVRVAYADDEIFLTLSPRGLCSIAELMIEAPELGIRRILDLVLLNKFGNPVEVQAVKAMMNKVGL